MRYVLISFLLVSRLLPAFAQTPTQTVPASSITLLLPQDTSKRETPSSVPPGNDQQSAPRYYSNIIKPNAITRKGLFTIHQVEDKYYFEIPDSLLKRDMVVVCR